MRLNTRPHVPSRLSLQWPGRLEPSRRGTLELCVRAENGRRPPRLHWLDADINHDIHYVTNELRRTLGKPVDKMSNYAYASMQEALYRTSNVTGRHRGPKRKAGYRAPSLQRMSSVSRAFSALCVYSKFGRHPHS